VYKRQLEVSPRSEEDKTSVRIRPAYTGKIGPRVDRQACLFILQVKEAMDDLEHAYAKSYYDGIVATVDLVVDSALKNLYNLTPGPPPKPISRV